MNTLRELRPHLAWALLIAVGCGWMIRATPAKPTLWLVLTDGQSLSDGVCTRVVGCNNVLTSSQPAGFNNFKLTNAGAGSIHEDTGTSLVGLTEVENGQESPASAIGAQFTYMSG